MLDQKINILIQFLKIILTLNDNNYQNIIYFKIITSAYQTSNGFIDDKHVIETYCIT